MRLGYAPLGGVFSHCALRGVAIEGAWPGVGVTLVVCLRVTEAHHKPPKVEKVSRKTD